MENVAEDLQGMGERLGGRCRVSSVGCGVKLEEETNMGDRVYQMISGISGMWL